MESTIVSFLPIILVQAIYAAFVFQIAKRTGKNVLAYCVITLIPGVGMLFFVYVMWSAFVGLLDAVNRLEKRATP